MENKFYLNISLLTNLFVFGVLITDCKFIHFKCFKSYRLIADHNVWFLLFVEDRMMSNNCFIPCYLDCK